MADPAPVDKEARKLLAFAQDLHRLSGRTILACQTARMKGKTTFIQRGQRMPQFVDIHFACAQERQMRAAFLMEVARVPKEERQRLRANALLVATQRAAARRQETQAVTSPTKE